MITLALFAEELWKQCLVKNKYKQWIPQVKENSPTSSRENCYKNVSSKLQWVKVLLKQTEFTHAVISFNQSHYFLWIREKKSSNWENPSVKTTTWSVTFRQNLMLNADVMHKTNRIVFIRMYLLWYTPYLLLLYLFSLSCFGKQRCYCMICLMWHAQIQKYCSVCKFILCD